MDLQLAYIDRLLSLRIPERNLLFDIAPRTTAAAADFDGALRAALRQPIGLPPLGALARPGMKVVIVSDDNTRPTPTARIIPLLLDDLNRAGVPDGDISIVISSGTHRAMTADELLEKYGREVLNRVTIYPHRYKDPAELAACGQTRSGNPIFANRRVLEADFRIAVGNIIPHHPAGWSGGAKAVLPGVGGEETVARMHLFGSAHPALGVVDSAMRREMEDFAEKIHLDFIVNTILNREGALVDVVCGHFIQAHRRGVALSKQVYGVQIPALADLTLSSTAPVDFDFFQGDKGITSAELATRPGGEMVCVTGCVEGISPAHPELAETVGKLSNAQIWAALEAGTIRDPLTAAEAIVLNDILSKMRVTLATDGLSAETCAAMRMRRVPPDALDAYVQERLREQPDLKIGVMRQSAELFPYLD